MSKDVLTMFIDATRAVAAREDLDPAVRAALERAAGRAERDSSQINPARDLYDLIQHVDAFGANGSPIGTSFAIPLTVEAVALLLGWETHPIIEQGRIVPGFRDSAGRLFFAIHVDAKVGRVGLTQRLMHLTEAARLPKIDFTDGIVPRLARFFPGLQTVGLQYHQWQYSGQDDLAAVRQPDGVFTVMESNTGSEGQEKWALLVSLMERFGLKPKNNRVNYFNPQFVNKTGRIFWVVFEEGVLKIDQDGEDEFITPEEFEREFVKGKLPVRLSKNLPIAVMFNGKNRFGLVLTPEGELKSGQAHFVGALAEAHDVPVAEKSRFPLTRIVSEQGSVSQPVSAGVSVERSVVGNPEGEKSGGSSGSVARDDSLAREMSFEPDTWEPTQSESSLFRIVGAVASDAEKGVDFHIVGASSPSPSRGALKDGFTEGWGEGEAPVQLLGTVAPISIFSKSPVSFALRVIR